MSASRDPLDGLAGSIDAQEEASKRRFRDAKRFTQGVTPRAGGVVRVQFSFPAEDHQLLALLVTRGLRQGLKLTKSQIVRAGLRGLFTMPPGEFAELVEQSAPLKPGRKPSS